MELQHIMAGMAMNVHIHTMCLGGGRKPGEPRLQSKQMQQEYVEQCTDNKLSSGSKLGCWS